MFSDCSAFIAFSPPPPSYPSSWTRPAVPRFSSLSPPPENIYMDFHHASVKRSRPPRYLLFSAFCYVRCVAPDARHGQLAARGVMSGCLCSRWWTPAHFTFFRHRVFFVGVALSFFCYKKPVSAGKIAPKPGPPVIGRTRTIIGVAKCIVMLWNAVGAFHTLLHVSAVSDYFPAEKPAGPTGGDESVWQRVQVVVTMWISPGVSMTYMTMSPPVLPLAGINWNELQLRNRLKSKDQKGIEI